MLSVKHALCAQQDNVFHSNSAIHTAFRNTTKSPAVAEKADRIGYSGIPGVYFKHMSSVLGRNVLVGCEHFGLSVEGFLADSFSPQSIDHISIARRDVQSYCRAAALLELIMLKRGVL